MSDIPVVIDERLVRRLVAEQFPQWAHLPVHAVARSGWDNRTFHLGNDLLARLPSGPAHAAQVLDEQRWLPYLAPHLPLAIPQPLALGRPGGGYPWPWSVYAWLPGRTAAECPVVDLVGFTADLARFLVSLQAVDASQGPAAGAQSFHRGGALSVYDTPCRAAIQALTGHIDTAVALQAWEQALASSWRRAPVWVHGDIALGNLLLRDGKLHAVIDFGQACVGDPACDLAIAWTFLRGAHRAAFRQALRVDQGTWWRGRGWALWKAAIIAARLASTNAAEGTACWQTLDEIVIECARTGALDRPTPMNPLIAPESHARGAPERTALSVNLNKVALLRNTRHLGIPSVTRAATQVLEAGAHGITVHPRPDERHIRAHDVHDLAALLKAWPEVEYNIEGNPLHNLMDFVRAVRPHQATFVPDSIGQFTSDHGWNLAENAQVLRPLIAECHALGVRVSLFMDPEPAAMAAAREVGADRVELYTESYASAFGTTNEATIRRLFADAARAALAAGLGVNAGHDLNRDNLPAFLREVPGVSEVSIGHALIADALELGYTETIRGYLKAIHAASATA